MSRMVVDQFGRKKWFDDAGEFHREDGPAVIFPDGGFIYAIHGKYHRLDGPAMVHSAMDKGGPMTKRWYVDGELHRVDGPAVETLNGTQMWYVKGQRVKTNREFQKAAGLSDVELATVVLKHGDVG